MTNETRKITHREMMMEGLKIHFPKYGQITFDNFINLYDNVDVEEELTKKEINHYIHVYSEMLPEKFEDFYRTFEVEYSVWLLNGEFWKDGEKKCEFLGKINVDLLHDYSKTVDRFLNKTLSKKLPFINHSKMVEIVLAEANIMPANTMINGHQKDEVKYFEDEAFGTKAINYKEERRKLTEKFQEKSRNMILESYFEKSNSSFGKSILDDLDWEEEN